MLYLTGDNIKIIILESANIEEIKKGRPAKTPDGTVLVCWCPDPVWLADKIMDAGGDAKAIARLIDEAAKRPQKEARPSREMHKVNLKQRDSMLAGYDGDPCPACGQLKMISSKTEGKWACEACGAEAKC